MLANGRDVAKASSKGGKVRIRNTAVTLVSAIFGLLFVELLVYPQVPRVSESYLTLRYLMYAIILAVLYRISDSFCNSSSFSLTVLLGPSAAACAASPYMLICGIPALWILCAIACFQLGHGVMACRFVPREELDDEIGRQIVAFSRMILAITIATLFTIV